MNRRRFLTAAGLTAGTAWVAPSVLSIDAAAAATRCGQCGPAQATAPELIIGGSGTTGDLASWIAPLGPPRAPQAVGKAGSTGSVFQATAAPCNFASNLLSGLQQSFALVSPLCTGRIAAGGVTAHLTATLAFNGVTAGATPTNGNAAYVQLQWLDSSNNATGTPLIYQANGTNTVSAAVPVNAVTAVVTVYLWSSQAFFCLVSSNQATASNISLKLVCP